MARGRSSNPISRPALQKPGSLSFAHFMPGAIPAASPATGLAKRHAAEQAALIAAALGHSSSDDCLCRRAIRVIHGH